MLHMRGSRGGDRGSVSPLTAAKTSGGLDAFYWFQIFALDSAVVEAQKF